MKVENKTHDGATYTLEFEKGNSESWYQLYRDGHKYLSRMYFNNIEHPVLNIWGETDSGCDAAVGDPVLKFTADETEVCFSIFDIMTTRDLFNLIQEGDKNV